MIQSFTHFRVLKTVAASFITLLVAHLLNFDYPIFPALAACFCIRQTFLSSLRRFFVESKITIFATGIALVGGAFIEMAQIQIHDTVLFSYLIAALCMGSVVVVIQHFGWYDAVFVGLLTVLYVLLVPAGELYPDQFLARGVLRLGSILVGSSIALCIDFVFSGYEYNRLFYRRTRQSLETIENMLDLFIEAIMFQSREMTDRILDKAVSALNLLNYVSDKLDDLEQEMDFRGEEIHKFTRHQVSVIQKLIRDMRLIGFQLESAAVNYIRLLDSIEENEDPLPELNYDMFSEKGRELAESLSFLRSAVESGDVEPLEKIPRVKEQSFDYSHLFQETEETSIRLLALDTMASINRIEFYLGSLADSLEEYFKLREEGGILAVDSKINYEQQ